MRIIGISFDSPEINAQFAEKNEFQYELWSDDEERTLAVHYGAATGPDDFAAARFTKVLDEDGDLILHYVDFFDVGAHPEDVLADLQQVFD